MVGGRISSDSRIGATVFRNDVRRTGARGIPIRFGRDPVGASEIDTRAIRRVLHLFESDSGERIRSAFRNPISPIGAGGSPQPSPAILTREFRIEEPVSVLLDDYAQFIESSSRPRH